MGAEAVGTKRGTRVELSLRLIRLAQATDGPGRVQAWPATRRMADP